MSPRTLLPLGLVALLVTAGLLWATQRDTPSPASYDLAGEPDAGTRTRPGQEPAAAPRTEDPRGRPQGLPRILPPEAAIEDVRDAQSLEGPARTQALAEAYAALGRIAATERILVALQRAVTAEEDVQVRGVVLAALGANRSEANVAWLAARLQAGPAGEDHLGALLALANAGDGVALEVGSLGGLTVRWGALPARDDVLAGLRHVLSVDGGGALREAVPILVRALAMESYAELRKVVEDLR